MAPEGYIPCITGFQLLWKVFKADRIQHAITQNTVVTTWYYGKTIYVKIPY